MHYIEIAKGQWPGPCESLGLQRIDGGAGISLLVEFRGPARPEELDGLAASEL